jgi:hypothetical protein
MPTRLLLLLALASLATSSLLAQPNPQYNIKDRDPPTGSNIRRNITEGSRIPINKTYGEMSPEEREAICKGTPCKMDFPFVFNFKVQ